MLCHDYIHDRPTGVVGLYLATVVAEQHVHNRERLEYSILIEYFALNTMKRSNRIIQEQYNTKISANADKQVQTSLLGLYSLVW